MKKLTICILISILLLPQILSYSLTPGEEITYFEPGLKKTISFKVNNYDGPTKLFELVPSGDGGELSKIINQVVYIEEPNLIIKEGETHQFYVDINFPDSLEYGRHVLYINIFGNDPSTGGQIAVQTLLAFKIVVYSLQPGKYLTGYLLPIDPGNIGETINIKANIHNLGTEDIKSARAKVDIYNEDTLITSVYSPDASLASKANTQLIAKLDTTGYAIGEYTARAVVEYDGETQDASNVRRFNIGDLSIDIINVTARKFENNKINKFDILVESKWNKAADVYADVILTDFYGAEISRFKTESISVGGWKRGTVPAYFDVKDIEDGNYILRVILNYEGKTSEKKFPVEILEIGEAEIVEEMPAPTGMLTIVLMGAIILLLVVIVIGMFFFLKRKGKK